MWRNCRSSKNDQKCTIPAPAYDLTWVRVQPQLRGVPRVSCVSFNNVSCFPTIAEEEKGGVEWVFGSAVADGNIWDGA